MKILSCDIRFDDYRYRSPMKFGGKVVDSATVLEVRLRAKDKAGKEAEGLAAMPLGNAWSWPSKTLTPAETMQGMRDYAGMLRDITARHGGEGDPMQLYWQML